MPKGLKLLIVGAVAVYLLSLAFVADVSFRFGRIDGQLELLEQRLTPAPRERD